MIEFAFEISLICIAVHALFWEGMLLFWFGRIIGILVWLPVFIITFLLLRIFKSAEYIGELSHKIESILTKPLFSCLICMSSVWTLLWLSYYKALAFDLYTLKLALVVCGFNVIADSVIYYFRNGSNQL